MTREITHMKAFAAALESMRNRVHDRPHSAHSGLVDQFFNTQRVRRRRRDRCRGPWNEGGDFQFVEAPAFQSLSREAEATAGEAGVDDRTTSSAGDPEMIEELLIEQLRDLSTQKASS
jgi:Mn-containing catalase